jgi:predicted nucleic acid-binding protein
MVLVDTSVWVAHFKYSKDSLIKLLVEDSVLCHPLIIAEIACGTPPSPRKRTLSDMSLLAKSHIANQTEVLTMIEQHQLYGKGCGYIDIALLCSALITPDTKLWTLDKRLAKLSEQFEVLYSPELLV